MSSPDESYNTIVQEETCLQSAFFSNFFGVEATLCIFVFLAIFKRRTSRRTSIRIGLLTYLAVLFAVTTAVQGLLLNWIQMGFITQRNYPGWPNGLSNHECVQFAWASVVARCRPLYNLLIGVSVTGSLFIRSNLHTTPPVSYASVSSLNARVELLPEHNVIHLDPAVSTQPEEETHVSREQDEWPVLFSKDIVV
ncbi:hypothetical protein V8E55_003188 [Tylopilus felleus]